MLFVIFQTTPISAKSTENPADDSHHDSQTADLSTPAVPNVQEAASTSTVASDPPASRPDVTSLSVTKKRKVKFVRSWLTDPNYKKWLRYDSVKNKMFCMFCTKQNKDGCWATTGTDNFR